MMLAAKPQTLSRDRVSWHLWNWERWMHHSRSPGRLPGRASGGIVGRSSIDFDELVEGVDRRLAEGCDCIISELPQPLRLAVHVAHGIAASKGDLTLAYDEACTVIGFGLYRRGFL